MSKALLYQLITIIATLATITINGLANALPINGQGTGEISDRFQVFFTPAGYVFSIWALIYLGLIAYSIYQALPAQRNNQTLQAIAPYYWASSLANIAWIYLWHYEIFYLTIIAMLGILITLILIYLRLNIGHTTPTPAFKWLVHTPFSIYMGWITVATIANVTSLLWLANWNSFGLAPEVWVPIVLSVAVIIAYLIARTRRDIAYLLVLVWAFAGITVKHNDVPIVAISATIAALVVAAFVIMSALPQKGKKQTLQPS